MVNSIEVWDINPYPYSHMVIEVSQKYTLKKITVSGTYGSGQTLCLHVEEDK